MWLFKGVSRTYCAFCDTKYAIDSLITTHKKPDPYVLIMNDLTHI